MSLIKYTAEIVKSYVYRNEIPQGELSGLIATIHQTLAELSEQTGTLPKIEEEPLATIPAEEETPRKPVLAVPLDQAVRRDAVICLICGRSNKAIRGHLSRTHGMDVKSYQKMFSLPPDFPMVAPDYSARRRQLAKDAGLGEKLREGRDAKKQSSAMQTGE